MAKTGIHANKSNSLFFDLRFSACKGYSKRFTDIVYGNIVKYPARSARCVDKGCSFCKGKANTHVYTYTFSDGTTKSNCGAYALEIPNIQPEDLIEIKKLIKQENEYLMKHLAELQVN